MKLPKLLLTYILVLFTVCFLGCPNQNSDVRQGNSSISKPNIVLIYADDLGYGDLGCYGATKVQTPNIDKLAQEGRMFTDAHSASAVCSPSRYGLLTGQYPLRRNFWGPISRETPLTIDTTHLTISRVLKDAGYSTACIGKWHLGFGDHGKTDYNKPLKPGPLELGFDYYYGIPLVNSGPPFVYVENHHVVGFDPTDPFVSGKRSITEKWPAKGWKTKFGGAKQAHALYKDEYIGTTLKDKAIEWMKQVRQTNSENPFFLYLATTNIHHPFTPAPQFTGSSECGRYGDFIHELDWIVGEVISAIEELGISNNTLVIFTSDNGGMLNNGGQDAWKAGHHLNGKLLGAKFGAWEGGHRIPFIAKWPGKIPANSKSNQLMCQVDLFATFATIVGESLSRDTITDSVDQLEAFTGNPKSMIRDQLIISPNHSSHLLVRKGDWVYIDAQDEGGFTNTEIGNHSLGGAAALMLTGYVNSDVVDGKIREDAPAAQLYNLSDDISQTTNVYDQHPKIVEDFKVLLENYRKSIGPYDELGYVARKK